MIVRKITKYGVKFIQMPDKNIQLAAAKELNSSNLRVLPLKNDNANVKLGRIDKHEIIVIVDDINDQGNPVASAMCGLIVGGDAIILPKGMYYV